MNNNNQNKTQQKTEESKQQAIRKFYIEHTEQNVDDKTIHTINSFTGTEITITPGDLEGIEKRREANTERD